MVTSSAVVGSSAMISFGSQPSAMAITTRWRMPPRKMVRILRQATLWLGDADHAQQLHGFGHCFFLGHVEVREHRLGQLHPMVNTGFSDVIGSWKIMPMSRPRMSASHLRKIQQFLPSNMMAADNLARRPRNKAHDGHRGHGLAGAGLTNNGDGFTLSRQCRKHHRQL